MSFVETYVMQAGKQSHDAMKVYLGKLLVKRYEKEYEPEYAAKLAVGVANYVFSDEPTVAEAKSFATENEALIQAKVKKLSNEEFVCVPLTCAVYNHCYAKYLSSGHKIGLFVHPFLGFIRSLQLVMRGAESVSFLDSWYPKVGYENVKPLLRLWHLGLYRELPNTPDSKVLMEQIAQFGAYAGTIEG